MEDLKQSDKTMTAVPVLKKKPGEFYFLGFLLLMMVVVLIETLKLDGIQKGMMSGPGSLPQLTAISMLFFLLVIFVRLLRNRYREGTVTAVVKYLFSAPVLIMIGLVILYGFFLEKLHFIMTTLLFMWMAMYFLDLKRPAHKLIVSVGVLAAIYVIFNTIFQIVLP